MGMPASPNCIARWAKSLLMTTKQLFTSLLAVLVMQAPQAALVSLARSIGFVLDPNSSVLCQHIMTLCSSLSDTLSRPLELVAAPGMFVGAVHKQLCFLLLHPVQEKMPGSMMAMHIAASLGMRSPCTECWA